MVVEEGEEEDLAEGEEGETPVVYELEEEEEDVDEDAEQAVSGEQTITYNVCGKEGSLCRSRYIR